MNVAIKGSPYKNKLVQDELKKINETYQVHTLLGFLDEHKGLRLGKYHVLIGPTSSGKSSVTRTMIVDAVMSSQNYTVGAFLTEETEESFYTEFSYINMGDDFLSRLTVISEQDRPDKTEKGFFDALKDLIVNQGVKILFIDNLTTATFYEAMKPDAQGAFIDKLRRVVRKYQVACVAVYHTRKNPYGNDSRLTTTEDIRGGSGAMSQAEYAYSVQKIICGSNIHTLVQVLKNRGYTGKDRYFIGDYIAQRRMFRSFKATNFERVKQIFKDRDKL